MAGYSLKLKVGLYLAAALTATLLVFTVVIFQQQRNESLAAAVSHVTEVSEVITKSTRFAMLQNQPYYVHRIIQDIGGQKNIDRIRIFSKEGTIIDSTYSAEIGLKVDRQAEGCHQCHQSEQPPEQLPQGKRARIFSAQNGQRMLASMQVLRNEPSCYTAACHAHSKSQPVLGVVDVVYSLDQIDRTTRDNTLRVAVFSLGFAIIAALLVSFFVQRLVYRPLRDLEAGAKRVSTGNLAQTIPVRSDDEFGRLAASFNVMTSALRASRDELQQWGRTMERKVEERTRKLRAIESEAARREKLASVGLLASGVAHELNGPLTGILTFAHLIRKTLPAGSQQSEDLELVIRETRRCAAIIRRLLDFAREKAPEKKLIDINRIIEETERLVERPAHLSDIEIKLELDAGLPAVWADEDQVKQVVMNILVNAQQAIQDRGTILVRTRVCPEPRSFEPGVAPAAMVEISISDTGCGIPEKDLPRIFDPFFTTKEVGKGTGLGLSVSHGIVKAHAGEIEVDSTVGAGSTFRIYLPVAGASEGAPSANQGENR